MEVKNNVARFDSVGCDLAVGTPPSAAAVRYVAASVEDAITGADVVVLAVWL